MCVCVIVFWVWTICVTKRRSSRAGIGNPKPEQETIKGTRTRNVSLPTQANHTARGARKQPPNQGAIHAASEDTTHTSHHTACHQCRKGLDYLRFRSFCWFGPSAGAAVSGLPYRRGGVAPAPRFQLCVRCAGLCVTKRRNSWACIGNPNPEQETIKGTHAQETSAYQRRPTTQGQPARCVG